MEDKVDFAIPLDVRCSLCGNCYELGCSVLATKKILSVSHSGLVTWLFTLSCTDSLCKGMLAFSSDPSRKPRFVASGDAVVISTEAQSRKRPRRAYVGEGYAVTSSLKENSSRGSIGEGVEEARALDALVQRQSRSHADNAATADVMLACLAERWDATPSRPVAREKVGKGVKRRKDARGIAKRIKGASKAPLACQRAAVGRMSGPEFAAARLAVRSLHRGGALNRVMSASRESRLSQL